MKVITHEKKTEMDMRRLKWELYQEIEKYGV